MAYRCFLPASLAGSGAWAATLSTLGYLLADSVSLLADITTGVGIGAALAATLALLALTTRSWYRRRYPSPPKRRVIAASDTEKRRLHHPKRH